MPRGESGRNAYNTQSRDTRSSGMNIDTSGRSGAGNSRYAGGGPSFGNGH